METNTDNKMKILVIILIITALILGAGLFWLVRSNAGKTKQLNTNSEPSTKQTNEITSAGLPLEQVIEDQKKTATEAAVKQPAASQDSAAQPAMPIEKVIEDQKQTAGAQIKNQTTTQSSMSLDEVIADQRKAATNNTK